MAAAINADERSAAANQRAHQGTVRVFHAGKSGAIDRLSHNEL